MSDRYCATAVGRLSHRRILAPSLWCAVWLWGCVASSDAKWPPAAPMKESIFFRNAGDASASFTIKHTNGEPLYRVECHTSKYEDDPSFDYSGDFECRLNSLYSEEAYSTLFTDTPRQSRDWESRARFIADELIGECGEYPEYGRIRTFRLRGMKITLVLSDIVFAGAEQAPPRQTQLALESFRFEIRVEPDEEAVSAIAEPLSYAKPSYVHPSDAKDFSRSCDVVKMAEDSR